MEVGQHPSGPRARSLEGPVGRAGTALRGLILLPFDQSRRDGRGAGDTAGADRLAARADHRVQQTVAGRGTAKAAPVEGVARRPGRRFRRAAPAFVRQCGAVRGPSLSRSRSKAHRRRGRVERQPNRVLQDVRLPVLRTVRPSAAGAGGGDGQRGRGHSWERHTRSVAGRAGPSDQGGPSADAGHAARCGSPPSRGRSPDMERGARKEELRQGGAVAGSTRRPSSSSWSCSCGGRPGSARRRA